MKSFRGERQQKHASTQLILAMVVLLASILLVNFLPSEENRGRTQQNIWESSVVRLP